MNRSIVIAGLALLASCSAPTPGPGPGAPTSAAPPSDAPAVVRRDLPGPGAESLATPPDTTPSAPTAPAVAAIVPPPGLLYVCATDVGGQPKRVGIEFAPKVHALCERHPEMGPCQYERNVCRQGGGKVFDVAGREITLATEAEYDRKVMRVRFKSN